MRRLASALCLALAACSTARTNEAAPLLGAAQSGGQVANADGADLAPLHQKSAHEKPRTARNRLSFLVGARSFTDDAFWGPVDAESSVGIEYAMIGRSGFGLELGLLGSFGLEESFSSNVDVTGAAAEVYAGLRKEFRVGSLRPYIGGGGSFIAAGIDNDSGGVVADDQDNSPAFYAHGGVLIDLGENAFFGVDARILRGSEVTFETIEGDADYEQISLVLGFTF